VNRIATPLISLCLCAFAIGRPPTNSITARQVIDRIQNKLGLPPRENTVDTFKAGDPDQTITGIVVTMMATYDVLERAAASGKNLVITHEPTFYNHLDQTEILTDRKDAVLSAKQAFIREHRLVVWRFHDGWHARRPDGILFGMTRALGWANYQNSQNEHLFIVPETTLNKLAENVGRKLKIDAMRVVGDRNLKISRIAFLPGAAGSARQIQLLESDNVEALIIGETPEWETIEYVADAVSQGKHKALVILGHIPSEQAGMAECALWLSKLVSEVPVEFIPAREPFWRPNQ
jgi:putative NIF3 family GTP cyclohydrolase 1 type 2